MTNYIDQLTEKEEKLLLKKLEFIQHSKELGKGNETHHSEGYKVYHTWNHNYYSSKDYVDNYLYISDYDIICHNRSENLKTFFTFMFNKFGEEWANEAIKYLSDKKAKKCVKFIENLINNQHTL